MLSKNPSEAASAFKRAETREFAVGEEMTQTMKLRRAVILERYAAQIEGLFR